MSAAKVAAQKVISESDPEVLLALQSLLATLTIFNVWLEEIDPDTGNLWWNRMGPGMLNGPWVMREEAGFVWMSMDARDTGQRQHFHTLDEAQMDCDRWHLEHGYLLVKPTCKP